MTTLLALASVVLASSVSLIGLLTLSISTQRVREIAAFFMSFAVGALLGDAFIHLIPQTFVSAGDRTLSRSLWVLGGMLIFFMIEKLIRIRRANAIVAINLLGDGIHNFVDGLLIGASYLVSTSLGLTTTLAVLVHEIPQELGDFGILVHSGLGVRRAVLFNAASASVAIAGTSMALWAGSVARDSVVNALVPITAGGFVYLASADLIPELQKDRGLRALLVQTGLISAGMAVMGVLTLVD